MNSEGLAGELKAPGALLLCYFVVPPLLNFALGPRDALWGRALISDFAQAAFAVAALRKLYPLKEGLHARLETWLGQFRQPPERTAELSGRAVFAAGRLTAAALLLPPVGHMLPRWLAFPATLAAIAYAAYMTYGVWQLYAPFVANPPAAPEPEPEPEPEARVPEVRCPRCGQKLEPADEFCGFCRRPADRPGPPPGALGH